ncbi:hypothetical protein L195_g033633 [Trifolium pratense]|uniref:Uncharacterized protein n=1 Tax=Trifolium pratense TaxID=57577 RepID=A0A2K3LGL7_TRIPR|nr:hypothetical protein L195_g033633 [Trifolium pratense]
MNELKPRYPNDDEWLFPITTSVPIGNLTDHTFYISDDKVRCGMAFSVAYNTAKNSNNNKELCVNVSSMLCNVYGSPTVFRTSTEAALNRIGVRPSKVVWLPYMAKECNIDKNEIPQLEWPTILVYFSCCVLVLLKKFTDKESYSDFMSRCICDLRELVGFDPDAKLDIPFDFRRANVIKTMLGSCSTLRHDVIKFILRKSNWGDAEIGGVCQYLCAELAWSGMRHFSLINDVLVKPQSPVLFDDRVLSEVEDFTEASEAVASHICPQLYMSVASYFEMLMVHSSRFPTLIAVAQEVKKGDTSCARSSASDSEVILTAGADPITVKALVNLHNSNC